MITWQDHPSDLGIMRHLGKSLASHMRCRRLGIKSVSCEKNRCGALLPGVCSQPGNYVVSCFAQAAGQVILEIAKTLSEMKIAGMDKPKHDYSDV